MPIFRQRRICRDPIDWRLHARRISYVARPAARSPGNELCDSAFAERFSSSGNIHREQKAGRANPPYYPGRPTRKPRESDMLAVLAIQKHAA